MGSLVSRMKTQRAENARRFARHSRKVYTSTTAVAKTNQSATHPCPYPVRWHGIALPHFLTYCICDVFSLPRIQPYSL